MRAAILALALMLPLPAIADDAGRITITGTASIDAQPDIAMVGAGVETVAETARAALSLNSALMKKVFSAVEELGIDERDIATSNFSINANWEHGPQGSKQKGFRVGNRITLRLRDVERVGEVLDVLADAGVNDAGNLRFMIEDPGTLLNDARKDAVQEARARAELYAQAAGVELGRIIDIREGGGRMPQHSMAMARADMMEAAPIAPGEQTLSVSVTITWELDEAE